MWEAEMEKDLAMVIKSLIIIFFLINFNKLIGDSGGGFVVKSGDRWYLRGVVSSALLDRETYMCDTHNYVVFTDVAQFKDWVIQHIDTYG